MATIYQRGKTWRAGIRRKGQPSITRSFDTKSEADDWATQEESRLDGGATVVEVVATPAATTWVDLFDRFVKEVTVTRRGRVAEESKLRKLSKFQEFKKPILTLTGEEVEAWAKGRLKEVSGSTVNRELATMSAVAKHAKKVWRCFKGVNPFTDLVWPKPNRPRKRRVPVLEQAAIAAALQWDGVSRPVTRKQMVAWCHAFGVATMMRAGEIMAVTWGNVHQQYLHIAMTKNSDERNVPLSTVALKLLGLLERGGPGQRLLPLLCSSTLSNYFIEAVAKAKIVDMHFHDSRREAITRAVPKVKNPMDLAKMSGHRDLRVLQKVYYAPEPEYLADLLG